VDLSNLLQDEADLYSLHTTPDGDNITPSASLGSNSVTPFTPFTSTAGSSKVKSEAASRTPS
jgi:hypothetical protein